ncbi:hypothetical protein [Rickettsia oklahomensis]|uniref:Uncharacterized protein n=1 Tax=Rickettsia oklahomensis TaxID=3141789 RepID=A0AAU7BY97_9RICK
MKRIIKVHDITTEFKNYFSKLNLDSVASFINTASTLGINLKDMGHYSAKMGKYSNERVGRKI